ncbi:MAG: hypothetical protein QNI90_19150 [Dinoroseobacter sp.]|nr:hypothetical protein [Dinoroseobacter sp.]MDJ0995701.1 hypothetical protein [Dinoroseobacter sp.]
MTTDQALSKVFSLLDRVQADPTSGMACHAELSRAIASLEAADVDVPPALHDLCAKLAAERRAFEAREADFDNMPV